VRSRYQICCVSRSDHLNHHLRIRAVGGVNPDGARWRMAEADVIAAIEAVRWSFYIRQAGREQAVVVAVSRYGSKYLKGADDRLAPDSLLALPECP
jgi:hypothetical protein